MPIRGGDRDANGCIPSAGYRWCPSLAECVRPFETDCPVSMSMSELLCSQSGGTVVQSQVCIGTGDFPRECTGSSIGIGTVEDESAVPTMMPREPTAMPTVVVNDTTSSPTSTMTEAKNDEVDCTPCDDQPTPNMIGKGKTCSESLATISMRCNGADNWIDKQFCRRTCFENGRGYEGDECCEAAAAVETKTPPPTADATDSDPGLVPDVAETSSPTSLAETASPTIGEPMEPTSELKESPVEPTATPTPTVASEERRNLQDDETETAEATGTFTDAPTDIAEDAGLEPTDAPTDMVEKNASEPTEGPTDIAEEEIPVSDPPVAAPTVAIDDTADVPSWSNCPPEESEETNICQCPSGTCFDPELGCVSTEEETKEPTSMPLIEEPTDMPTFVLTGEGSELGEGDGSREPTSGGLGKIKTSILTGFVGTIVILSREFFM